MNPGDRFLHFRIESFLDRGSFGDVYIAENFRDNRRCALKLVRKGVGEDEEAKYAAEVYGVRLQKALHDPEDRVVRVFDFGADDGSGTFFIEMEYIEGDDLSTLIRNRNRPPDPVEVARIGASLCGLLEWLANARVELDGRVVTSIVHGDLKPRNVRIERKTGKLKVLDFGIARALKETLVTMPFNSPAYTSPERLDTGKADLQSDLWAAGVMLYELMMGHLPFQAENRQLLERRILSKEPPPELPANYPPTLRRTVMRMLRRNAAERFRSPAEARAALEQLLGAAPGVDETVRDTSAPRHDPDPTVRSERRPFSAASPMLRRPWMASAAWRLGLFGLFGFLSITALASGYRTFNNSSELAAELNNEHISDLDKAWEQYQAIEQDTWMRWLNYPARRALRMRLKTAAFQIADEYRNSDSPQVFERQWRQGATFLSRAMELDTNDSVAKAGLRLCEGHLARIQVTSTAARKDLALRVKNANIAAQKFQEAASLRGKWPDPYLGLARLYTYETTDMDRALAALEKANELGHKMGRRERAQLADGYRRMVDRHWDESRKMRELPQQERALLDKAQNHCATASQLYQEVGVFQNAVDNHKVLILRCQEIADRITHLEPAAPPPAGVAAQ